MAKNLRYGLELRQELISGSREVHLTVGPNFGPEGRNTIRGQMYDLPLVANTGRHVLQGFSLADSAPNLGTVLVRDAALRVGQMYGDGASATAI